MKFVEKANLFGKSHVAKMNVSPKLWPVYIGLFVAGALWAQQQFALMMLKELNKRKKERENEKTTTTEPRPKDQSTHRAPMPFNPADLLSDLPPGVTAHGPSTEE